MVVTGQNTTDLQRSFETFTHGNTEIFHFCVVLSALDQNIADFIYSQNNSDVIYQKIDQVNVKNRKRSKQSRCELKAHGLLWQESHFSEVHNFELSPHQKSYGFK